MLTHEAVKQILKRVRTRKLSPQQAYSKLRHLSYEAMDFAKIDHNRFLRKGLPEVVYAPGKTFGQLKEIVRCILKSKQPLMITRIGEKDYRALKRAFPKLRYSKPGRLAYEPRSNSETKVKTGAVSVVTAGTSDIPIAEEAAVTLEVMGFRVNRIYDCGVAGLHRLLDQLEVIGKSKIVICIAGMEGALPSVVAGLVDKPVIAVPTSVGYGSNFKGMAALLTMLNSCAQGVSVVNIDNGFGAACSAILMLNSMKAD